MATFKDTNIKVLNCSEERGLHLEIGGQTIEVPPETVNQFLSGNVPMMDLTVQNILVSMALAGLDLKSKDSEVKTFIEGRTVKAWR